MKSVLEVELLGLRVDVFRVELGLGFGFDLGLGLRKEMMAKPRVGKRVSIMGK